MPTYDYQCEACGHRFEKFQSITASPIRNCPQCHKNKVKRLLGTGAGIIFKGSGFYITDYRSESYKDAAKADSGAGGTADKKEGVDAKPADKTPAASDAKKAPAAAETKPAAPTKSESKAHKKKSK